MKGFSDQYQSHKIKSKSEMQLNVCKVDHEKWVKINFQFRI